MKVSSLSATEVPRLLIRRGESRVDLRELGEKKGPLFPTPPSLGVVIGTFAAVPYVHLQLEARRRFYPNLPLLVHDDASPIAKDLARLCGEYGAEFENAESRAPACKGDLMAFVGGLLWAKERKIDLLVKLSRRFVPLVDWTPFLTELALESQYPTYCSWTSSFNFGFRTECVGMAVSEWHDLRLVNEIVFRIMEPGEPFVEGFLHNLARRAALHRCKEAVAFDARVGLRPPDRDGYSPWPFMGTDRRTRSENFLWHDFARPEDYHVLGRGWGLPYRIDEYRDPNGGCGARP